MLLSEYSNLKLCDFGLAKKIVDLIQTDAENQKVIQDIIINNYSQKVGHLIIWHQNSFKMMEFTVSTQIYGLLDVYYMN